MKQYNFTKEIDKKIIETYNKKNRTKGDIAFLSSSLKISKNAIYKRAKKLKLTNIPIIINWEDQELQLIYKNINKSVNYIYNLFLKNNYKRSKSSIKNKLNDIRKNARGESYNAHTLAICFGVSPDVVEKWIHKNYLIAKKIGNLFSIQPVNIKKFIQNYPNKFEIAKVDQIWFLDLLFDGKLFKNSN